jgi:hypothetical protein
VSGQRLLISIGHDDGSIYHLGVVRLTMNGALDTGFGDGGLALATMHNTNAETVAIASDGGIVVGGSVGTSDGTARFFVARFLAA